MYRQGSKLDRIIETMSIIGIISGFLRFIVISTSAGDGFLAELTGDFLADVGISFTGYDILQSVLSAEHQLMRHHLSFNLLQEWLIYIGIPYIAVLLVLSLRLSWGRWRHGLSAALSLVGIVDMIYSVMYKFPDLLYRVVLEISGDGILGLIGTHFEESLKSFIREFIIQFLREGYWLCLVALVVIFFASAAAYIKNED